MLKSVETIGLVWDGTVHEFDVGDEVQMASFGNYAVKELEFYKKGYVGIVISIAPITVS